MVICCTRDRDWNPLTIEIQNPSYRAFVNRWTFQCWSGIYFWTYQPISQTNTGTYLGSSWRGLIPFTNSWTLFPSCCLPILDLPSEWKRHLMGKKLIIILYQCFMLGSALGEGHSWNKCPAPWLLPNTYQSLQFG